MDNLGTSTGFCYQTREMWAFVGTAVTILKILIPVVLVIIGVIALGKAVIADDEKEIKSAVNKLIKKFIVAVCIFFIPAIISGLFGMISGFSEVKADYTVCIDCVMSKTKCPK